MGSSPYEPAGLRRCPTCGNGVTLRRVAVSPSGNSVPYPSVPPAPAMPECVRELVMDVRTSLLYVPSPVVRTMLSDRLAAVEAHYAKEVR